MGYRTAPRWRSSLAGLPMALRRRDVLMAFSRLLAPRSRCQAMAGWVAGAYTPRQAVARAVEHGYKLRGLWDQLRCVRVRGFAAEEVFASWGSDPGEPTMKLPERAPSLYLRERDLIDAWTAAAGLGPEQVAVGGGSVLAARWGHRGSDGVDVVVQGATPTSRCWGCARDPTRSLNAVGRRVVGATRSCGSDNVEDRGYGHAGQVRALCRVGGVPRGTQSVCRILRAGRRGRLVPGRFYGQARSLSAPFCSQG